MDEVTQVKFNGSNIITSSTDGLVAVHDMSHGVVDEDDNFTAALNVGTSIEEMGLYGPENERLWIRTGTESLHLWDWRIATQNELEGGHRAFCDLLEARENASRLASTTSAAATFSEV